eukprot:g2485.t1
MISEEYFGRNSAHATAASDDMVYDAATVPPQFDMTKNHDLGTLLYLCATTSAASPPPGYNETYGYPDGIGALIVEGPFPYKNGPPVWTNSTLWGAYGLLNAPGRYTNGECDAVPASSPFYKSDLKPVPLTDGLKDCLIGCNLTQVSETGHDPCHVGSVTYPTNSPMSCFDVGPGFAVHYFVKSSMSSFSTKTLIGLANSVKTLATGRATSTALTSDNNNNNNNNNNDNDSTKKDACATNDAGAGEGEERGVVEARSYSTLDLALQAERLKDAPATPVDIAVSQTSSSTLSLTWKHDVDVALHGSCYVEYELRYCRTGYTFEAWKLKRVLSPQCCLEELAHGTRYTIQIRARMRIHAVPEATSNGKISADSKKGPWSSWSETFEAATDHSLVDVRHVNDERLEAFLSGNMEPFPQDYTQDQLVDKAERVMTAVVEVASLAVGGKAGMFAKLAKRAWQVRKYGIMAVIFSEDLQQVVMTLSMLASAAAKDLKLTNQDLTIGLYYLLWLRCKDRKAFPDSQLDEHSAGVTGVLEAESSASILEELSWHMPLAFYAYETSPSSVQWLVNKYPSRSGGADSFKLIASVARAHRVAEGDAGAVAEKSKPVFVPAFHLMANTSRKIAVLSVRGTKQLEDWFADMQAGVVSVEGDTFHSGMYAAAKWMTEKGGILEWFKKLRASGYSISVVGHSLGGAVGTIISLLAGKEMKESFPVYGYGIPACVGQEMAEKCMEGTDFYPKVTSLVNHDDFVSRCSKANIMALAAEVKARRKEWEPLLSEDFKGGLTRAKSLWAPNRRQPAQLIGAPATSSSSSSSSSSSTETVPEIVSRNYSKADADRLVVPGKICHVYKWRGTSRAATINFHHPSLQRIECFDNMFDDHNRRCIRASLRDVQAQRRATVEPPMWQPLQPPCGCAVCGFDVSWSRTGKAETEAARASYHCHACGLICCKSCCSNHISLPEIGILTMARVCNVCISKY